MRIDSSGNITGTTSGTAMKAPLLQATNGNVATYGGTTPTLHSPASATLAFSMGGAERMRIDSDGATIYNGRELRVKRPNGSGDIPPDRKSTRLNSIS